VCIKLRSITRSEQRCSLVPIRIHQGLSRADRGVNISGPNADVDRSLNHGLIRLGYCMIQPSPLLLRSTSTPCPGSPPFSPNDKLGGTDQRLVVLIALPTAEKILNKLFNLHPKVSAHLQLPGRLGQPSHMFYI